MDTALQSIAFMSSVFKSVAAEVSVVLMDWEFVIERDYIAWR